MATAKKARAARSGKKAGATRSAAKSSGAPKAQAPAAKVTPPTVPASATATKAKDKPDKPDKPKRPKLVRDSFTIPKAEYAALQELKQRAAKLGRPAKKSEVLRAGVNALAAMGDSAFVAALATVPAIKTGRPSKA